MTASQKTVFGAALLLCGLGVGFGVATAVRSDSATPVSASAPPARAAEATGSRNSTTEPRNTRPTRERQRSVGITAEEVRRIVAEELARVELEAAEPPRPVAADPALNSDPTRRKAVREAVLALRRVMIEHDIRYNVGAGSPLARPDPERMAQFPDESVWLANHLGWVERNPARYELLAPDGSGFDPAREHGAFVFTGALDRAIATSASAALVFERGIGPDGVVTLQNTGTILCKGDFDGKAHLGSYATVIVEGDLAGRIESESYATIFVRGEMTGTFESKSYANLRVMGGFSGRLSLFDGNNVYLGGYTSQAAIDTIKFRGRASVTVESTDRSPGKYTIKPGVELIVLEPR